MAENTSVIHVNDGDFEEQVMKAGQPVLVDFWAPWCGPCRAMAPLLEDLAKEYDGKVKITKINIDDNQKSATAYGVKSIPTLILFKDGKALDTIVGLVPKERLQNFINQSI